VRCDVEAADRFLEPSEHIDTTALPGQGVDAFRRKRKVPLEAGERLPEVPHEKEGDAPVAQAST